MKTISRVAVSLACLLPSLTLRAAAPTVEPAHCDAPQADYILHEWGTFTTVTGSDGSLLPGVEREEESLPDFVYSHEAMHNNTFIPIPLRKGISWHRPLANVTVRMETPVIYFYTKNPFAARVEVGFRGGTISQWYPQRSAGEHLPPLQRDVLGVPLQRENTLDFSKGFEGSIVWEVTVEPPTEDAFGRVFRGGETPSWLHPRQPASAIVTNQLGESEKYLFYRGLGRIDPPIGFRATGTSLHVVNGSSEPLTHWLVFDLDPAQGARWSRPAAVAGMTQSGQDIDPIPLEQEAYRPEWKKALYHDAVSMLTDAGLTRAEADGMLQTWWTSYFEQAGLRVFWVVPSTYVEEVLPLQVAPRPRELVRVMVGRSEILTPAFEQRLLADFAATTDENPNPWLHDRYFGAYAARVQQLNDRTAGR